MAITKAKPVRSRICRWRGDVGEECWTLLGQHRGRVWLARRAGYSSGGAVRVEFDGPWVLRREEKRGDVIGFLHTHPHGDAKPSERDVRTMRAWCSAFGKPLICVIATEDVIAGFRFDDGESSRPVPLAFVQECPRGILVGVERNGRQAAS